MKVSFFETVRYIPPEALPSGWPVASGIYDREAGARAYESMIERLQYVEDLGFDWVSVSEHHYSPRILSPSPIVAAAFIAARLTKLTIALLGPIVPHSNPVRVAEELAMLDTLARGVAYGPLEVMGKASRYYREACARQGWQPTPEQIIYRANMLVADTDEEAHALLRAQPDQAPFAMRAGVRDAVKTLDSRNIA